MNTPLNMSTPQSTLNNPNIAFNWVYDDILHGSVSIEESEQDDIRPVNRRLLFDEDLRNLDQDHIANNILNIRNIVQSDYEELCAKDEICPICYGDFKSDNSRVICKLGCSHYFHTECMFTFCSHVTNQNHNSRAKCPLCRVIC